MNVLIVDDDKLARKGLIAVIDWERYGLCVVGDVQNGKKALEFLENHPVDLVFTDIDMPEMNGLELMKICKENYPETDFVIFSVYEDFSFARQALRLGALDYISKIEFDPEECDAILKKIVETYQNKRREKAERNLKTEENWEGETVRKLEEEFRSGRWIFDEDELEKVKNRYESEQIFNNLNYLNVATNLAYFELTGKAEDINNEVNKYRSVTAGQIKEAAQKTFVRENCSTLYYKSNLPT